MKIPFFNNGMPSVEWLKNAHQTPPCTPDLFLFERGPYSFFFEYGDLQDKMPKHQMVSPWYTVPAYTVERYGCLKQTVQEDPFPIAFEDHLPQRQIKRQKIRGELYAIKLPSPILIDSYRQNGVHFIRRRVRINIPIQDDNGPISLSAWMYFGKPEYWGPMIDWDAQFYKNGRGSQFKDVKVYLDNTSEFNNHYYFTKNDLINQDKGAKCFVHLKSISEPASSQDSRAA